MTKFRTQKPPLGTPEFITLFALITSLTAFSIDAMLPALGQIGEALNVSNQNNTQLVVTTFIFGMVFGELFFGPLSDSIGRKKAIFIGLIVFAAGTVLSMTASSMESLLIGRVIQGFGVSGPKIASRALIRDRYEGDAMAKIMSLIFGVFIIVPMIAPAIGQLIMNAADWRSIFLMFLILAMVIAVWLGIRQPETLHPKNRIPLSASTISKNAVSIIKQPKVMAYTAAAGLVFGSQLLYLSTAQAIMVELYGTGNRFPLYFAILALSIGTAAFINSRLVMRYGMHTLSTVALVGLTLFGTSMFGISLPYNGTPPFWIFMSLCFLLSFCIGILMENLGAMAMQSLGLVAGIGASLVASISSIIAVVFSVGLGRLYNETVFPLAVGYVLAGIVSIVLIQSARGHGLSGPV